MLRLTLPFTNQILINLTQQDDLVQGETVDYIVDKTGNTLKALCNTRLIGDISIITISLKCSVFVPVHIQSIADIRIMIYCLSGGLQVKHSVGRQHHILENTHYSQLFADKRITDISIKGDAKLFMICMAGDMLKNLVPQHDYPLLKASSIRIINPELNDLIQTVVYGEEQLSLHRVLLVSKALQLLFLDLEQLKNDVTTVSTNKSDLHKLEKAKILIGQNLQTPYSLIELSRQVGLNDFKLKKGFKEVYGNTVFGYLAELRMEKAKMMLSAAQYTVSEVAHHVGYKNAHHFTVAFKKKFGYLPSRRP